MKVPYKVVNFKGLMKKSVPLTLATSLLFTSGFISDLIPKSYISEITLKTAKADYVQGSGYEKGAYQQGAYLPTNTAIDNRTPYEFKGKKNLVWSKKISGFDKLIAVDKDKNLYLLGTEKIIAIDKNGNTKWEKNYSGVSSWDDAVLASDGTLVVQANYSSCIYAINTENGELKWKYTSVDDSSKIAIGAEGNFYFLTTLNDFTGSYPYLVVLNNEGKVVSKVKISNSNSDPITGTDDLVISNDSTIYFTHESTLYAYDKQLNLKWKLNSSSDVKLNRVYADRGVSLDQEGNPFVSAFYDNKYQLLKINKNDGRVIFSVPVNVKSKKNIAFGKDNTIYVTTEALGTFAINPDGSTKWNNPIGSSSLDSRIMLDKNDNIIVYGSRGGRDAYILEKEYGDEIDSYIDIGRELVLTENGFYTISGSETRFYAFGDKLQEAIEAVEKAESTKTQADVDAAREKVNALPDGQDKTDLNNRLDKVQAEIDARNIKLNLANKDIIISNSYMLHLTGSVSGMPAGETFTVETEIAGVKKTGMVNSNGTFQLMFQGSELPEGEYTNFPVTIIGSNGHRVTSLYQGKVTVDKTNPIITITGVEEGKAYNGKAIPVINVTDDKKVGQVNIILNGIPFISGTEVKVPGNYTLVVRAKDEAGNEEEKTIHFTVNSTADQKLQDAIKAVEKAESTKTQADVDAAREKVNALPDGQDKTDLNNRLDKVQAEIDAQKEASKVPAPTIQKAEFDEKGYLRVVIANDGHPTTKVIVIKDINGRQLFRQNAILDKENVFNLGKISEGYTVTVEAAAYDYKKGRYSDVVSQNVTYTNTEQPEPPKVSDVPAPIIQKAEFDEKGVLTVVVADDGQPTSKVIGIFDENGRQLYYVNAILGKGNTFNIKRVGTYTVKVVAYDSRRQKYSEVVTKQVTFDGSNPETPPSSNIPAPTLQKLELDEKNVLHIQVADDGKSTLKVVTIKRPDGTQYQRFTIGKTETMIVMPKISGDYEVIVQAYDSYTGKYSEPVTNKVTVQVQTNTNMPTVPAPIVERAEIDEKNVLHLLVQDDQQPTQKIVSIKNSVGRELYRYNVTVGKEMTFYLSALPDDYTVKVVAYDNRLGKYSDAVEMSLTTKKDTSNPEGI
ncbi:PQQ-binding-like beta-propeller repeat protein [Aneurinibacillus thermoaerophilus]|uniref:outer membrane protein assembly factor BamB family protein n=1 Tax=Aneurinibacillus thermoaerophilus TaxID=143495 RepID=UPI002E1D43AB|nr:PQQ-binding-like beta-propeller repeat protein [Aneurinibacillus thermoaerophilus]